MQKKKKEGKSSRLTSQKSTIFTCLLTMRVYIDMRSSYMKNCD